MESWSLESSDLLSSRIYERESCFHESVRASKEPRESDLATDVKEVQFGPYYYRKSGNVILEIWQISFSFMLNTYILAEFL